MMGTLVELVAPVVEPISVDQAKAHLRVDDNDQDDVIDRLITTAREEVEHTTRRRMISRAFDYVLDDFPYTICIPIEPVRSVWAITYIDGAGATQTLSTSVYNVSIQNGRCEIRPKTGQVWPQIELDRLGAVTVRLFIGHAVQFTVANASDIITAEGHGLMDTGKVTVWAHSGALPDQLNERTVYFVRDVAGDTLKLTTTSVGAAINFSTDGASGAYLFIGAVPKSMTQAMLMLISHWYEHRESVGDRQAYEIPQSAEALMMSNRLAQL